MRRIKRNILLTSIIVVLSLLFCFVSAEEVTSLRPDIRELFQDNKAIIYAINIRNFGAVDFDKDGIIIPQNGDTRGTFTLAKEKLKDLKDLGINVVYLLPITKTGKLKALGTAGSLYAMDSFVEIDPELTDKTSNMTAYEQIKDFIDEAHSLGLNVVVDLASCGSYDMSLNKPDWFILDKNDENVIPSDWTDVRLFKIYNEDGTLYQETLNNFKSFIDMVESLGFDGIRADVAAIKPPEFWSEIIDWARNKSNFKNENFLFLAEASPMWSNPAPKGVNKYSTIDELLNSGFDAYYGSWSDFSNLKTKKEFDKRMTQNLLILKKYKDKSILGALATHDQKSPLLRNEKWGKNYWDMVL